MLTREMFSHDALPYHQPPAQYTGEKFGVEYLYQQSGVQLSLPSKQDEQEEEDMIDEGIGDECMYLPPSQDSSRDEFSEDVSTFAPVYEESKEDKEVHMYLGWICHNLKCMLFMCILRMVRMRTSYLVHHQRPLTPLESLVGAKCPS